MRIHSIPTALGRTTSPGRELTRFCTARDGTKAKGHQLEAGKAAFIRDHRAARGKQLKLPKSKTQGSPSSILRAQGSAKHPDPGLVQRHHSEQSAC